MDKQESEEQRKELVQLHWHGRFGNRMFQYAFGCQYSKTYDLTYLPPSSWEGTVLFKPFIGSKIQADKLLCKKLNQTTNDNLEYRKKGMKEYDERNNTSTEFVCFQYEQNMGKVNICFDDLNSMYMPFIFKFYDKEFLLKLFEFSDEVKKSHIYKTFEAHKGTYDIVHVRRGDINNKNFKGSHSVVSLKSYHDAIKKYNFIKPIWISDSTNINTLNHRWKYMTHLDRWSYPHGQQRLQEIFYSWFPDFIAIYFARRVIRSNSSFSWWACFLNGTDEIYSPVIKDKPPNREGLRHECDVEFVKGNQPHFMGSSNNQFFQDINIGVKNIILL